MTYHVVGCQNYGPFLGTLNIRCRIKIEIQKGTVILRTTHVALYYNLLVVGVGVNKALLPLYPKP